MEKHTCKLCFRSFANGRALGGHMRSHVTAAKAEQRQSHHKPHEEPSASSTSSHEAEEQGDGYGLRENPRKSFRVVDPEFSSTFAAVDAGSSSVVQDRESETESPRAAPQHSLQRRRSKRRRPSAAAEATAAAAPEPDPVSSVSDTTPEEDVAISLMLLSRDAWTKDQFAYEAYSHDSDEEEPEQQQQQGSEGSENEEEETPVAMRARQQGKGRSKYQCGTCRKVFRSYQALGGHRASHKKSNGCAPPGHPQIPGAFKANADPEANKVHECPVCFRVFRSGQALGGHKRSHLIAGHATTITITSSSPAAPPLPPSPFVLNAAATSASNTWVAAAAAPKHGESLFDLNLPAPIDDEVEMSAVSDAGFVADPPAN